MSSSILPAPAAVRSPVSKAEIARAESLLIAAALVLGLTPSSAAAYADSAVGMLLAFRDRER